MPWSKFDHCVIAWGGVIARAVVAVPILLVVTLYGYTRFEATNAVLALLGFFSVGVAVFNLLPVKPSKAQSLGESFLKPSNAFARSENVGRPLRDDWNGTLSISLYVAVN